MKMLRLLLAILFIFCNYLTFAQLATYSAIGTTSTTDALSPTIINPSLKFSSFTRGKGILAVSATDRFSSTDFTSLLTLTETDYYSFHIAIPAGQRLTITNLVLTSDRNTNGIRNMVLRSSLDNFSTNLNAAAIAFPATTSQINTIATPTLTNLTSSFIEFRLYGFGAINCSGTWRIQALTVNGSVNTFADILPPTLTHYNIINPTQIQLRFSETLSKTQAQTLTNYTINNGIGNPKNATLQSPDSTTVALNFQNSLILAQNYSFIINNLRDISGNINATITQNLTYTDIEKPTLLRCVPITNDALDLYFSEELNLASSQNAANYSVCNEPNVTAAVRDTDKSLVHLLFAAPITENANRVITVKNIVDNQGLTNQETATNFSIDTRKPVIDSLLTTSPTQITLIFSEPVDRISAELRNNYTHSLFGFPSSARLDNQDFRRVYLTFSSQMVQGQSYTLRTTQVADVNGNSMTTRTIPFIYDKVPPVAPEIKLLNLRLIELYFSEFMDKTTAEILTNYELKLNGVTPVACNLVWLCDKNFTTVFLRPTSQLLDNQNYTLNIRNVRDRQQNIIANTNLNFNTIQPTFNKIYVVDSKTIKLYFSEIISQASAENLANYSITNNTISQVRRNLTDFSVIDIIFTNNFALGTTNNLIINNLQDNSANNINAAISVPVTINNFIQAATVISPRLLDVKFSKVVPNVSLLDTTNYFINNLIGKPIGITRNQDDSTTVRLLLRNMINPNIVYNLAVSGFALDCNEFLTASKIDFQDDRLAPTVVSVSAISATEIVVTFSKNLDKITAEALNHYQVLGFGNPVDVTLSTTDLRVVTLKFSANLQQNITYTLSVERVKDRQGNVMISQNITFQRPAQPRLNELLISELMPDPDPVKNLPNVEYIELYNNSTTAFQLIGLKLQDATTTTTLKDWVLQPDEFVLIMATGNKNLFAMPLQTKIMEVSSMLSLTNSGEEIKILDQDNKLIFNVLYSDSWYKNDIKKNGGWSLEMINPKSVCLNKAANYIASQDSTGGTPSFKNSVWKTQLDTVKPKIVNCIVKTARQIEITFSEDVDSLAMLTSANYLINNNLAINSLQYLTSSKVLLNTTTNLDSAILYTVSARNIKDCAENQANTSFQFAIGTRAKENDLLITEIFADETPRVGLPLGEYIEIFNRSNRLINLGSVRLSDESGSVILPQKIIKPNEYLTLSGTTKADSLGALGITSFPSLGNTGEKLTLSDTAKNGITIFSILYSDSWYGNDIKKLGGWSLEMIDVNFPCGEAQNWTASTNAKGGTPNLINSVARENSDKIAPQIASFRVIDDKNLDVSFNEKMNENSIKNLLNFSTNPAITIQNITIKSDRQIQITLQNSINSSITYKLNILNVADCSGNILTTSLDFGLGRSPQKGEIVITEIFADESPAVKLPLTEWIEIYNTTNDLLTLNGSKLADDNTEISLPNVIIQPKTYVVLCSTTKVDSLAKVVNRNQIIGVTSFPSLANAGEKLELLNGLKSVVHTVTYSDSWYYDDVKKLGGWSLEMIDANNLCGEGENWTVSVDISGGTPARQNSVKADNIDKITPNLTGVKWLNSTELELNFSEKMDSLTIMNKANFVIVSQNSPQIEIKNLAFIDNKTVKLITVTNLNNNILYELQAKNIKDCSGNAIVLSSVFFGKGTSPQVYELLITEIMADPSPTVQLPEREYIEIFNNSRSLLDLGTVKLQDETATINLPNTVLKPQEYAILCSTTSFDLFQKAFANLPNTRIIAVVGFPSLNNTGENLQLLNGLKSVVHRVSFSDTWYKDEVKRQGGWSLEMIDTNFPCLESSNWRASIHASGGTPARENSLKAVNADTNPPVIESLNVLDNNTLQLIFNENLDSLSATNLQNYVIVPTIEIEKITWKDGKIVVLQTKNLNVSIVYELQIKAIKDCSGNVMIAKIFTFGLGERPEKNDVIITELMSDPSPTVNLPESEYIELYNPTNKIINMQGATLTNGTTTARFTNLIILPKTYVLLCPTTSVESFRKLQANANIFGLSPWVSLANDGDTLTLRNLRNRLVFDVLYSSSWYRDAEKADGGWSLEMIDVNFPCVQNSNWTASENKNGGTPATTNSVAKPNPDTQAPILQKFDVVDTQTLRLIFNEKLDSLSSLSASYKITSINNSQNNSQNITLTVLQIQYSPNSNNTIIIKLREIIAPKIIYALAVNGVADCSNNGGVTAQTKTFVLPELGEKGDLIINEVLFNPPVGGVDFVEIYNKSDKFIDLKNWGLTRIYQGQIENMKVFSSQTLIIAPKSYIVFSPNITQLKIQYPQGVDSVWVQTAIPTYSDDNGSVILMRFDNLIIDQFDYDKNYHFKLLDDKSGVSLERIDFEVATNDKNNWFSAAAPKFGTAGYKNSQAKGSISQQNKCWWVENEVITPDGDGFMDFAFIRYACNQTSFVANGTVYDSEGRKIKTLLQSQILGAEGFFRWDGDMDNGQKARIGYYVLHIQTFNLKGEREDWQLKCVVGSRE